MNVLELKRVSKSYGSFLAVDDVSLTIEKGAILSLLGPSGCGKTTTLRMIAGFTAPNSGSVVINGSDVGHLKPYDRNVGLVFQDYALFPHMTVFQNVAYGMKYRGIAASEIPARVARMLGLVRLGSMEGRYPRELSGGQQQRVALARALATDPQVVLLDEPLSALDAKLRLELRLELKEILRSVEATTIVVTHDQEEALSLGDEVVVMRDGRIAQRGSPTAIYNDPADRFVAEFVGRSNWFNAGNWRDAANGFVNYESVAGISICGQAKPNTSGKVDLCIRPENIDVLAAGEPATMDENTMPGTVVDVAPLGADVHIVIDIDHGPRVLAIQKSGSQRTSFGVGQSVRIGFSPADVLVF